MSRKREYISKETRLKVYEKYNHKCAYCGKDITYDQMQVDHFIPFRKGNNLPELREQISSIDNYMPACRMCNYYKKAKGLESFRHNIEKIYKKLEKTFLYRLAKKYNMINETPHKIVFYFEQKDTECN